MELMYVILIASIFFVYFDASKNKIGKIPGEKGFFNLSAGGWAIVVWLLWIIAFPAYLIKRTKLIEAAKQHPQEASARNLKLILLGALFIIVTIKAVLSAGNVSLVKKGTLNIDKSLTIGEAFDNYEYFSNVKWSTLTSDNGKEIVEVAGTVDFNKDPKGLELAKIVKTMDVVFQFTVNKDESFEISAFGIRSLDLNGKKNEQDIRDMVSLISSLKKIYNNEPVS